MMHAVPNFLTTAIRSIHQQRPLLDRAQRWFNRVERVPGGNYVEVWFLTQGCSWDRQSGCTMCNYGRGARPSESELIDSVRDGLAAINVKVDELMVSPSGSMLDPIEVPEAARRGIYDLVRNFPAKKFFIETRPETITQETVAELVTSIPGKRLVIELGLESSCIWVGRFCVNRSHTPQQVSGAIEIINQYRVASFCNVSLGVAFLNEAEAVSDAVRTIRWALNNGAANIVVFPVHVKPHTLVNKLFEMGLYEPPSLWALVEVLKQCADQAHRIEIAWYRSYYDNKSKVRRSPHTCARCYNTVLMLLDQYRAEQTPESIAALDAVECPCRNLWNERFNRHSMLPLPERVFQSYAALAAILRLESWWDENYLEIKAALEESLPLVMESNDLRMEHGNKQGETHGD